MKRFKKRRDKPALVSYINPFPITVKKSVRLIALSQKSFILVSNGDEVTSRSRSKYCELIAFKNKITCLHKILKSSLDLKS